MNDKSVYRKKLDDMLGDDKDRYCDEDIHKLMDDYLDWVLTSGNPVMTFEDWYKLNKK